MATRATIKVEGVTYCKAYKHWDGNPDATLPWLKAFNERFAKERGADPQYKMAQLLRDSVRSAKAFSLDESATTGWGVVDHDADYGQDYEYTLMADGSVKVSE
jgi:hypothetical protein